jgi:hypothetical protein
MNQFIEGKRNLGCGVTTADGLVAHVCQQLYKPSVLSCLSADWVFELQPIANCNRRIADICKKSALVQKNVKLMYKVNIFSYSRYVYPL